MSKKKNGLGTKYLKAGGYSIIVSVIVVAIVIFVNLVVRSFPASSTQIDLRGDQLFTLSEETERFVENLSEEVKIYFIAQPGNEDENLSKLLDKYTELSDKIVVEQIDPGLNPGFFVDEKAGLTENSLYIESEKRGRDIDFYDVYYPEYDKQSLESYYSYYGTYPVATFNAENCITSALDYVTTDVLPIVYSLSGHGETELSASYVSYLTEDNVEHKILNLGNEEKVPDDCSCILITSPEQDVTSDEKDIILEYLKNGGRLMFVSDFDKIKEKPNLLSITSYYGIKAVDGYVCEGNSSYHVSNRPAYIYPSMISHEITDSLNGYYLMLVNSHGIDITDDKRNTVNISPLLVTTEKAFSKVNYDKGTSELPKMEEGDTEGPFSLAVSATETNENGKDTKLIWIGTESILYENGGAGNISSVNAKFFVNSLGWMCEKESFSVAAKSMAPDTLIIPESSSNLLITVFVVIIPLAVVITGVVVWVRRRAK